MPISVHALAIDTFVPHLQNLSEFLDRGAARLGPDVLPGLRLAPDMYPLAYQVQIACYQAEDAVARLSGAPPRTLELLDEPLDRLKARIAAAVEALRGTSEGALDGAEDRPIVRPLRDDLRIEATGLQLLRDWVLPNFYFHVVTAYGILRHHGVELGKPDFMRHILPYIRQGA